MLKAVKSAVLRQLVTSKTQSAPISIAQANAGLARIPLADYLQYTEFGSIATGDDSKSETHSNYMFCAVGDEFFVGFGFQLNGSFLQAGNGLAVDIETTFKSLPVDSVVHTAEFAWDNFAPALNLWYDRQSKYCKHQTVLKMNEYRRRLFLDSATEALHKPSQLRIRSIDRYVFFTIPYKGSLGDGDSLEEFLQNVAQVRLTVESTLNQSKLSPSILNRSATVRLLRKLMNPHLSSDELNRLNPLPNDAEPLPLGSTISDMITVKSTSAEVLDYGSIIFSGGGSSVAATHLTIDKYPKHLYPAEWGNLTGNLKNRDERIKQPYYLYSNIHIMHPDKAKERVELSLGLLSKQARESSEWMKKTIPQIYERAANSEHFLKSIANGSTPVRMYSGIVIFSEPKRARMDAEQLITSWVNRGFLFSRERHISFPMYCMALPYQYKPDWDEPRNGIARAKLCESINAASIFPATSDWLGNVPTIKESATGEKFWYSNGIPLVTGRGCMGYLDLFESPTNYNFSIIATSGAGKSFFANDLVRDIYSRDGLVFVIDMGESYKDICELLGGSNLRFPPSDPKSINPFWGISTDDEFLENYEALVACLGSMAFRSREPSNEQLSALENGLTKAYGIYRDRLDLPSIYEFFKDIGKHNNPMLPDIANLFERFAIGPDSKWFTGAPQVDLSNPFTILELNDLSNAVVLKRVIFVTILMLITRKMYSTHVVDRTRPKMLLLDEAWALLDDDNAAPFIEKAFRTIRKFFGAAGFITQSCADISMSKASKAAFANSAWKIFLAQKGDSISVMRKEMLLGSAISEQVADVLDGIRRRDNFSELVVEMDGTFSAFRFFVDKFTGYVYSSKAQDKGLISQVASEHGVSREEAMEILAGLRNV